jgi:hypothetical protein
LFENIFEVFFHLDRNVQVVRLGEDEDGADEEVLGRHVAVDAEEDARRLVLADVQLLQWRGVLRTVFKREF